MPTREQLNDSIEAFILNKPNDYVYTNSDLNFLRKYDKCEDAGLNEKVVFDKVWSLASKMKEADEAENAFYGNVLVTHGGGGKAITSAPEGISFHVMNTNYFCHEITKALTSGRQSNNFMRYDFGTLAEYFYLGNTDGLPSYDLVISHPPAKCPHAELDHDSLLASEARKNARVYYAVRSFAFVEPQGSLLVIVPREVALKTHEDITDLLFHVEGATFDFDVPSAAGDDFILKYTRL
jgi:hypothetical protein